MGLLEKLPKRNKLIIILLTALAVFVGVLTLTFSYFTTSGSCTILCHSMRPQEASWKQSAHSNIPCMSCHAPPGGAVALTLEHIVASRFVPMEFIFGYHKPINSEGEVSEHIEDERCFRCHSPETRKFTPSPGIKIDGQAHLKHLDAGLRCTTCHNRVTHKAMDDGNTKYEKGELGEKFKYKNFMTMDQGCWRCHSRFKPYKSSKNGAVAPTKCSTCHTKEFNTVPDYHKSLGGKTWEQRHGNIARKDIEFCQNCHENEGELGQETGIKTCYSCHKVVFPHDTKTADAGRNWDKIHYLQKNTSLCQRCHKENGPEPQGMEAKDPDFCQKCHHRAFAAETKELGIDTSTRWKGFHFKIVKNTGAEKCFSCHKPTYCAKCHVKGQKAQPGTMTEFNRRYWNEDFKSWLN